MSDHIASAATWISSLSTAQQQIAGTYYGQRGLFNWGFTQELGCPDLSAMNGQLSRVSFQELLIARSDFTYYASKASTVRFVLIDGDVSSVRFANLKHSVALKIDHETRQIHHQDPQGDGMRSIIAESLSTTFPDYKIIDYQVPQQRDNYSCALINLCNLVGFAHNKVPDPTLHEKLMDIRAAQAPALLDHIVESPIHVVKIEGVPLTREKWREMAKALANRQPVALSLHNDLLDVNFLLRLAGNVDPVCNLQ